MNKNLLTDYEIRRWWRQQIIAWRGGSFLKRFPVKCPECGKRSWDPYAERERNEISRAALERMNYYRCGHRGDIRLMIRWM